MRFFMIWKLVYSFIGETSWMFPENYDGGYSRDYLTRKFASNLRFIENDKIIHLYTTAPKFNLYNILFLIIQY